MARRLQEGDDPYGTFPPHPAVDWTATTTRRQSNGKTRRYVKVTCPACGYERYMSASTVAHRIRWGRFSGNCVRCRPVTKPEDLRLSDGCGRIVLSDRYCPDPDLSRCYHITGDGRSWLAEFERNEHLLGL